MHLTAFVPGSLVPAELAAELTAALQVPALARLLASSTLTSESASAPGLADSTWIARDAYGVLPPAPTAPYAWAALTGVDDATVQVWHADPVHIAIGRDSLIVQDLADAAPNEVESDALIASANECLRSAGAILRRAGAHWFLFAARAWAMSPRPLSSVLGQPLPIASPDETDALQWSRLHNEIQMLWHSSPVNDAREAMDRPVINALWLHGGGTWRPRPAMRWPRVHTGRADLRGLAMAAGAVTSGPDDAVAGDALLVWDEALTAARDGEWSRWLAAMHAIDRRLAALPRSATLDLVLTGRRRIRVRSARPTDRYCIWRRTALAQALSE